MTSIDTLQELGFKWLSPAQLTQLKALKALYADWNTRINVVSRKDMNMFELHHIVHSLSIARFIQFMPGTKIMDLGTGGGFPGIPLAIAFPECRFHLVDSVGKKLKVIEAVAEAIGLTNIRTFHTRAEEMPYQYDFVVSRAVAPVADLVGWSRGKISGNSRHSIKNGLICLKGGNLDEELSGIRKYQKLAVADFFSDEYFSEKYVVYISGPFR